MSLTLLTSSTVLVDTALLHAALLPVGAGTPSGLPQSTDRVGSSALGEQMMGKEKPVWRLAFFSRLEERKGIKLFVDAVGSLNVTNERFEVCGQ